MQKKCIHTKRENRIKKSYHWKLRHFNIHGSCRWICVAWTLRKYNHWVSEEICSYYKCSGKPTHPLFVFYICIDNVACEHQLNVNGPFVKRISTLINFQLEKYQDVIKATEEFETKLISIGMCILKNSSASNSLIMPISAPL